MIVIFRDEYSPVGTAIRQICNSWGNHIAYLSSDTIYEVGWFGFRKTSSTERFRYKKIGPLTLYKIRIYEIENAPEGFEEKIVEFFEKKIAEKRKYDFLLLIVTGIGIVLKIPFSIIFKINLKDKYTCTEGMAEAFKYAGMDIKVEDYLTPDKWENAPFLKLKGEY
ncbi:MAG: hypothetical protein ACTSRP_02075 [Candidatus Helarchaeota archaeon]